MQHLSASRLLSAWERGRRRPALERALLLLGASEPEEAAQAIASLPMGCRDARILDLRAAVFGPRLDAVVSCPACRESLEFTLAVADVALPDEPDLPDTLSISRDGYEIAFRLPTSEDLAAVAQRPEPDRRSVLVERCVLEARHGDAPLGAEAVPETVIAAMLERMAELDPSPSISLSCPCCGHEWQSPFDIVTFLWAEVDTWARRTLHEVHVLASSYGWSESDILAMSAWRRHQYLQMAAR